MQLLQRCTERCSLALLLAGTGCVNIDSFNPVTPQGLAISNLFNLELVLSLALFFLIAGLVGYSLVRFRRRPGDKDPGQVSGNRKFEIAWTVVPIVVLGTMFVLTLRTMQDVNQSSPSALSVELIGHQWWWEFRYPSAHVITANEFHVPVGVPLYLSIESTDVIHSFWVPQFGWMQDAVPGKTTRSQSRSTRQESTRAPVRNSVGSNTPGCGLRWSPTS